MSSNQFKNDCGLHLSKQPYKLRIHEEHYCCRWLLLRSEIFLKNRPIFTIIHRKERHSSLLKKFFKINHGLQYRGSINILDWWVLKFCVFAHDRRNYWKMLLTSDIGLNTKIELSSISISFPVPSNQFKNDCGLHLSSRPY